MFQKSKTIENQKDIELSWLINLFELYGYDDYAIFRRITYLTQLNKYYIANHFVFNKTTKEEIKKYSIVISNTLFLNIFI